MTYCGKNCESCEQREALACPGCESGPGRRLSGDCEIALCCQEKGHASCETCTIGQSGCAKQRNCESVPAERQALMERRAAQRAEAGAHAPLLSKWLWVMFWLVVPSSVASLMTMEQVVNVMPGLQLPGSILSALCSMVYAYALWKLKEIRSMYRTAAMMMVPCALLSLLQALLPEDRIGLSLLVALPCVALGLLEEYNEYKGHAAVLEGVEDEASRQWEKLWRWNVWLLLGVLGSFLVILILPLLGALALLVACIGVLVIHVLKLVYLYRMTKLFREWN